MIGGVELAGAGIDHARAGGGNGRTCWNRPIPAPPLPEGGRGWSGIHPGSTAELVVGRPTAVGGDWRRPEVNGAGGDRDQNNYFGR